MESHAVELLAAVFLGWAIGVGAQPRAVARALGGKRTEKLIRLLELLEAPPERDRDDDDDDARETDARETVERFERRLAEELRREDP